MILSRFSSFLSKSRFLLTLVYRIIVPPRLLIFEKFSNPPFLFQPPLLLILVTKTQTVQIFWTIFLANVITHYHYTVCKVYKQYIVRLAISRSIFDRYFERKILFKEQKVFKILFLCLNALIL